MAFTTVNPVAVGDITKKTQYDTLFNNTLASIHKDATDTFFESASALHFDNDVAINGKEAGGTVRNMLFMSTADRIHLGSTGNQSWIMGDQTPGYTTDGTNEAGRIAVLEASTRVTTAGGDGTSSIVSFYTGSWTYLSSSVFGAQDGTFQVRRQLAGRYQVRTPSGTSLTDYTFNIMCSTSTNNLGGVILSGSDLQFDFDDGATPSLSDSGFLIQFYRFT